MSQRFGRRRLLDLLGLTPRQQRIVATVVFGGPIVCFLLLALFGGLLTGFSGKQVTTQPASSVFLPAAATQPKAGSRYKLTGTITKLDGYVRFSGVATFNITIEHEGIPGVLIAGRQMFKAYSGPPEMALNVTVRNLNLDKSAVGHKIDFVIESRDNQWVVIELSGK